MPDPLLTIRGLQSGYGDVQVLWGVDLAVETGEIFSIVGSNGAGKTTLLRTISGLVRAASGSVVYAGEEIVGDEPDTILGKGIAHVPEGRRLFRGLSVRDNLLLGAYLRRDRDAIMADLELVYRVFPVLRERRSQDATTLSGGEQQMCAVGRGIMSRPKLLMIDELSLGLAPQAVERITEALRSINKTGMSILIVEQDVITALELAHHACVIEKGRVAISGEAHALAKNPKIREAYIGI
jgi:branched-chain amino acid transport system ATP-binding protein